MDTLAAASEALPVVTLAEISKHSSCDDLWMVIYNKVYDVSNFKNTHPGGAEVLIDCGGVDATHAFEDVGHTKEALLILANNVVGILPSHEQIAYAPPKPDKEQERILRRKKKWNQERFRHRASVAVFASLAITALVGFAMLQRVRWSRAIP